MLAEDQYPRWFVAVLRGHDLDFGHPFGQAEGGLHRVGESSFDPVAADQSIDNDPDVVLFVAGEFGEFGAEFDEFAIDDGPHETLAGQVGQQRLVCALATSYDRSQHLEPSSLGQEQHLIDDLLRGLPDELLAGLGVVGHTNPGEQEPQVVVDLGDGADCRARVPTGRFLVDGDGRRQALDEVDVGFVHLAQELAGIRRQRFDVAALALGVDRVEGQGRLPGAGETGEDDELVSREIEVDVGEVVFPGAADDDLVAHRARIPVTPRRTSVRSPSCCTTRRQSATNVVTRLPMPGRRSMTSTRTGLKPGNGGVSGLPS